MNPQQQDFSSFDEYLRQGEPTQQEAASNWKTAIGLQAVDGLQPSAYLIDVAKRNIEGEITIEETRKLIDSYYQSKTARTPKEEEEEEADKVSANIAKILSTKTFAFNTNGYVSLHRRIFEGRFMLSVRETLELQPSLPSSISAHWDMKSITKYLPNIRGISAMP